MFFNPIITILFQEISKLFSTDHQLEVIVLGNEPQTKNFIQFAQENSIQIKKIYSTEVGFSKTDFLDESCKNIVITDTFLDTFELFEIILSLKNDNKICYTFSNNKLEKFTTQDLINQENTKYNTAFLAQLKSKIIAIIGVGSIGYEILREITKYQPQQLLLIDHSEGAIFKAKLFLKEHSIDAEYILSDIHDKNYLNFVFEKFSPQIIIHTAAYKHLSLVQENIIPAIKTNIFGLKNLTDLAIKHKIEKFLFVSSDKAVNPKSVLGATKRIGEQYILSLANYVEKMQEEHCKFSLVRFGNVLGSSGSVVTLFLDQIKKGAIEVTHPEMERYFVSKKELSWYFIHVLAMMQGNELYVIDSQIKMNIKELAEKIQIIEDSKAKIDFGKPLKSEKLTEELFHETDLVAETTHPNIKLVTEKIHHSFIDITEDLKILESAIQNFENTRAIEIINSMLK